LEFRDISRVSEVLTAKRMKIVDPYSQRRNCSPLNVLFSDALFDRLSTAVNARC